MSSKIFASYKKNICVLSLCACFVLPGLVIAAVVSPTASVTVTKSFVYTNFDGGDFIFFTNATAPGCSTGWFIRPTDAGYKTAVAAVLTAQAGGNFLVVYGDNADLWAGSPSGQYCHVYAVGIAS